MMLIMKTLGFDSRERQLTGSDKLIEFTSYVDNNKLQLKVIQLDLQ